MELTVPVSRIAFGGDGVGRLPDGKVCFVPGALPGETLEIREGQLYVCGDPVDESRIAMASGIDMVIANGAQPEKLYDIIDGGPVGTRFIGRRDL